MLGKTSIAIIIFVTSFLLSFGAIFFANPGLLAKIKPVQTTKETIAEKKLSTPLISKYVVVDLKQMTITLNEGENVLNTFPVVSKGKPGSYYETIGGIYKNDYKTPLHFSSIGHVYMPSSIHVFGNYFIHGIPYYPSGEKVSSAYSGGCIRLLDKDALEVYNFIERGTPIVITQGSSSDFFATENAPTTMMSEEMTRLMVASISLEALTQDVTIEGISDWADMTRRDLLPVLLIQKDKRVATTYAKYLGEETFISLMNQKAASLGLTNTHFYSVTEPVATNYEDYKRFLNYISTYKSYLNNLTLATTSVSR